MAEAQLKLSRRFVLAAACAAPVVGAAVRGPAAPVRHSGPFDTAQDRLDPESHFLLPHPPPPQQGKETPDGVRGDEGGACRAAARWSRALTQLRKAVAAVAALEGGADEAAYGDALERFNRALERLLIARAPDLAALAEKLSLACVHLAWELPAGEPAMAALERDAKSLSRALSRGLSRALSRGPARA